MDSEVEMRDSALVKAVGLDGSGRFDLHEPSDHPLDRCYAESIDEIIAVQTCSAWTSQNTVSIRVKKGISIPARRVKQRYLRFHPNANGVNLYSHYTVSL